MKNINFFPSKPSNFSITTASNSHLLPSHSCLPIHLHTHSLIYPLSCQLTPANAYDDGVSSSQRRGRYSRNTGPGFSISNVGLPKTGPSALATLQSSCRTRLRCLSPCCTISGRPAQSCTFIFKYFCSTFVSEVATIELAEKVAAYST